MFTRPFRYCFCMILCCALTACGSKDEGSAPGSSPTSVSPAVAQDTEAPSAPTGVKLSGSTSTSLALNWQAARDNLGVFEYRILRDGRQIGVAGKDRLSFLDTTCAPDTTYRYTLLAVDEKGNLSAPSEEITAKTQAATAAADKTPPTAPTALKAEASTRDTVSFSWQAASDNAGVIAYEIFRNGILVASVGSDVYRYTASGLQGGTVYLFAVTARDAAGNVSPQSSPLSLSTLSTSTTSSSSSSGGTASSSSSSSSSSGGSTSSSSSSSSSSSGAGPLGTDGALSPDDPTGGWGTVVAGPDGAVSSAYGAWYATVSVAQNTLTPGQPITVSADLSLSGGYLAALTRAGASIDKMVMLVTAERAFDATGWARQAADQDSSTLLTPSGLAIEGGSIGAVTNRFGYPFRSPIDVLVELPVPASALNGGTANFAFTAEPTLPTDLPPGLYRIRADFGFKSRNARVDSTTGRWTGLSSLNMTTLGARPAPPIVGSYLYSDVIPASGKNVAGQMVDATRLQARMPWTILHDYSTNGYAGVVADEDSQRFALAQKHLIHDDVVLPPGGSYRIEPTFPTEKADPRGNLRWNWTSGEVSGTVTGPDGVTTRLPTLPFISKSTSSHPGPTTGNPAYTAWTPTQQGRYTVVVKGWIQDASGRRYEGGGTYRFWVARRMTMATATFQGMSYPVGYKYGRDIAFFPAVPADVTITTTLYPNSDSSAAEKQVFSNSGQASPYGIFSVAQGMKQVEFKTPGEYHAKITATYIDAKRDLWVCAMRHAGVIYPTTNPTIVARGKKLRLGTQYVDRGETGREGYIDANGVNHLERIAFPYRGGDLLLMANDETAAMNRIEPVLTYEKIGATPGSWDPRLGDSGTTNIYTKTSNGLSPHMFPEYITDRQYFYAAAARPGFMGRFIVADGDTQAPDWSTSRHSFGGQAGATQNGDIPGDLYRFFGGVVIRNQGQAPAYANYLSSGAILPKGSNNNRIVAAGSEDIVGSKGTKSRFFVAGFRPGTVLTEGSVWKPGMQVDPLLAVKLSLKLDQLKGGTWTTLGTAEAMGGADGSWLSPTAFTLKDAGAYRFSLTGEWADSTGRKFVGGMPGLPAEGGEFYVASALRPAGAAGLNVSLPTLSSFRFNDKLVVSGTSTASSVRYTLLMPGAILGQGEIPVVNGKYSIALDPGTLNKTTPIYDFISFLTRQPMTYGGRILHLSLASLEQHNGVEFWDVKRVIARGTTVIAVK